MNGNALTPAARIIARFGIDRLVSWTGRHRSRVHAWTWARAKGGTGGHVPLSARHAIMRGAAEAGDPIEPNDFELREGEAYFVEAEPAAVQ